MFWVAQSSVALSCRWGNGACERFTVMLCTCLCGSDFFLSMREGFPFWVKFCLDQFLIAFFLLTAMAWSSMQDALAAFKRGEFVLVMDSEDRENECDLVIAAENITAAQMAFAIRHSTGIICVVADKDAWSDSDCTPQLASTATGMRRISTCPLTSCLARPRGSPQQIGP